MCQHPLWEEHSVKPVYMSVLLSRNKFLRSKTMSNVSCRPRCTNTGQEISLDLRIKVRNRGSNKRDMCSENWWKSCNPLHHINRKTYRRICNSSGVAFAHWNSGICTRLRANCIRPATATNCSFTWSHHEGSLWLKNLYSCKKMTQSIY